MFIRLATVLVNERTVTVKRNALPTWLVTLLMKGLPTLS